MTADTETLQRNYKEAVFSALTQFQFIESLLKDCIEASYAIIQDVTNDRLDVILKKDQLEKEALQRLCTRYMDLTKNKKLVSRIKELAKERNRIAHEACFEFYRDQISGIDDEELFEKGIEIQKRADEASTLVTELLRELRMLEEGQG